MQERRAPILEHKAYAAPSVFQVDNLLREARRQRATPDGAIPAVCVLDPDGDLAQHLIATRQAAPHPHWACYHTKLYAFTCAGIECGVVPCAVGGSFAVLVAEELFASGCQLLISITSAGQIVPAGQPPYFVLIERALRDEGTSYHYLPPAPYSSIRPSLLDRVQEAFAGAATQVLRGASWTTDAPFRETAEAIEFARAEGIAGVEMEAAALYAFAEAQGRDVVCFAHITNQMAVTEGDFEKGLAGGSHDALQVISLTVKRLSSAGIEPSGDLSPNVKPVKGNTAKLAIVILSGLTPNLRNGEIPAKNPFAALRQVYVRPRILRWCLAVTRIQGHTRSE